MKDVTRHISHPIQCLLWGRSAGRCAFRGCNQPLWRSHVTLESVNVAEKAHIYSFAEDGPRGHAELTADEINSIENLMLVCHACHRVIDKAKDGGRYSPELLKRWKAEHEARVERVTSIHPDRRSHVVHYTANIGDASVKLSRNATYDALTPARFAAEEEPIVLGISDSAIRDRDAEFWATESKNLTRKFDSRLREKIENDGISHVSLFALAPQPLLILLGSMLTDLVLTDVFAHHKEPEGWTWADEGEDLGFRVTPPPPDAKGDPCLVLSVSGTVSDDRISHAAIGRDIAIWRLDVMEAHNDCLKTREQLSAFRAAVRLLLDQIKARHGQTTQLHIFPALPAAMAVELGRHNILVNSVAPGFMVTPMSVVNGVDETTTPDFIEWYVTRRKIPLGRSGVPEDVSGTVVFLASDYCRYMTGQLLVVDGGLMSTF